MGTAHSSKFFHALNFKYDGNGSIKKLSVILQIDSKRLLYYHTNNILPSPEDLVKIEKALSISKFELMLSMGIYDNSLKSLLQKEAKKISKNLKTPTLKKPKAIEPVFRTNSGRLFQGDCIEVMKTLKDESIDLIFADPPFNLNKIYPSGMDDNLSDSEYILWCEEWLTECVRLLKYGGSIFVWNLPEWNLYLGEFLNHRLKFRDLIAADIKFSLPIQNKLYPSHYSLLYYCKGDKPATFHPDRLPMEICRKCSNETKDYGGYKDKMNPKGINLTDVWYDIPPVRHTKYKKRQGANELSVKLMDRIIEMSSEEGDTILDPFGGSGTTYVVSEMKKRKWIGIELDSCKIIIDRFKEINEEREYLKTIRENYNILFPPKIAMKRKALGIWTTDTFKEKKKSV